MSLKKLPKINAKAPTGVKWDTPSDAMSKWDASLVSASSDNATITMYDAIGSDGWTEGVTAKRIAAALRSIGDRDVTVSLNSPRIVLEVVRPFRAMTVLGHGRWRMTALRGGTRPS